VIFNKFIVLQFISLIAHSCVSEFRRTAKPSSHIHCESPDLPADFQFEPLII